MADENPTQNPFLGETPVPPVDTPTAPQQNQAPLSSPQSEEKPEVEEVSLSPEPIRSPESKWRHRVLWRTLIVVILVLLTAAGVYFWFQPKLSVEENPESVSTETNNDASAEDAPEEETRPVLQSETGPTIAEDNAAYKSENFKAGEIVIGGEMEFLMDPDEVAPLLVENIRGEAFTEKNKQEVKLVVSWTTNKLSQAAVRYSKGIGQTEKAVDEDDYSYNHSVIISGLDPASTYLYTIDALDRYGNQVRSEPHAVFTGARTVSLFDLIAGAIGEVFGWAVTDK